MNTNEHTASFTGRVAMVTGGGSGLGAAIAAALAAQGACVLVCDIDGEAAAATARTIDPAGARMRPVPMDVTRSDEVAATVDLAVKTFGRLDCAVNNAGIAQPPVTLAKLNEADWRRVIDVNLTSVYLCMKHQIPAMLQQGGGAIVNMASALGRVGTVAGAAYVAAKHGVIGLTKAAALEYAARGLRINAVAPGVIDTKLIRTTLDDATQTRLRALHPIGRFGTAEEVAALVLFLLSDQASFITGSTHSVDGGWTAH